MDKSIRMYTTFQLIAFGRDRDERRTMNFHVIQLGSRKKALGGNDGKFVAPELGSLS